VDGVLTISFVPHLEGIFKMTPTINGIGIPASPINICVSMRSLVSRMRQDVQVRSWWFVVVVVVVIVVFVVVVVIVVAVVVVVVVVFVVFNSSDG
jgi:uncharacterized membrane protein YhaH (DUF805 family)